MHQMLKIGIPYSAERRQEALEFYGGWTKSFCYAFFILAMLNSMARADCTFGIAILGIFSILHRHKQLASIYVATLAFSIVVDLVWTVVHGVYLHDFGRIPKMAASSMASIMHMHKLSLAISIVQLLAKVPGCYFSYRYYILLPVQKSTEMEDYCRAEGAKGAAFGKLGGRPNTGGKDARSQAEKNEHGN